MILTDLPDNRLNNCLNRCFAIQFQSFLILILVTSAQPSTVMQMCRFKVTVIVHEHSVGTRYTQHIHTHTHSSQRDLGQRLSTIQTELMLH